MSGRDAAVALDQAGSSRNWIESPAFDLAFVLVVPAFGLLTVLAFFSISERLATMATLMLAFAHYHSTFTFYLWDENRAYHRAHWISYFAGPALVAVAFSALVIGEYQRAISFVILFWNAYHAVRQSCGIASIYRHRAGVFDPLQKQVTNGAILATSLWSVLWDVDTHPDVYEIFSAVAPWFPSLLRTGWAPSPSCC
jgi:hypothetical protein